MFNNKDFCKTARLCYYILDKEDPSSLIRIFKPYISVFSNHGAKTLNNLYFYTN